MSKWEVGGGAESKVLPRPRYSLHLASTVLVAEPPRLLRTVTLWGFVGQLIRSSYLPLPRLVIVPISSLVEVT